MANVTPEPIMKVALGFMAAKHLFVANEVGCSSSLRQGRQRLMSLRSVPAFHRTMRIVADAMVCLFLEPVKAVDDAHRHGGRLASRASIWPRDHF